MNKITSYLKKFLEILSPSPAIDGLEISDVSLKFLHLGHAQKAASLRLPAGVLNSGVVKNKDLFLKALAQAHNQIDPNPKKKLHVIVTLADVNIYTQVFKLPPLSEDNLKEAVELNLQVISPFDPGNGYTSWQVVGVTPAGEYEIIGAFVDKSIVDNMSSDLESMGFEMMALEFQAISMGRLIRNRVSSLDVAGSYIVFRLFSGGLSFFIIQNGQVYFDHFLKWSAVLGAETTLKEDVFRNTIIEETRKITNFYSSRFGVRAEKLVLINEFNNKEVPKILSDNLGIATLNLQLPKFSKVTSDWWPVLGASLRGQESRSSDVEINLAGTKRTNAFYKDKVMVIIRFWEKVIWGALAIMVGIFFVTNIIVSRESDATTVRYQEAISRQEPANVKNLENSSRKFNSLVSALSQLEKNVFDWTPILEALVSLDSLGTTRIERISISGKSQPVNLVGSSNSQEEVINFKKAVEASPRFKDVLLPIQNIVARGDGKWLFQMTFGLE